jgi:hypothetical protein
MLSVAVMAHPSRAPLVRDLVQSIDADRVDVAWDEKNQEWHTGRRALLAYDPSAEWHVVLQDDALVCQDLIAGLTCALTVVPRNAALGLYLGRTRPLRSRIGKTVAAATDETGWIVLTQLLWGVGVVLPTAFIDEIVWRGDRTHVLEYDRRLSTVFRRMSMPVWYPWPSLVDHRDEPSLLRHDGGQHRCAHRFEGVGWSALASGWWEGRVLRTQGQNRLTMPRRIVPRGVR